jgi:hypothetical protein
MQTNLQRLFTGVFFIVVVQCSFATTEQQMFDTARIKSKEVYPKGISKSTKAIKYYDTLKVENGITLLDEHDMSTLVDMNGKVLAKFPFGLTNISPDGTMIGSMGPDLVKLDADLNLLWEKNDVYAHHEITTDENGAIYLLTHDTHEFMGLHVNFDGLRIYSDSGDLIYEWHVFDHLEEFVSVISKSTYLKNLHNPYDSTKGMEKYISQDPERFFFHLNPVNTDTDFEFTHFNSIQVLPENDISKKIPAFKKGNLLLSFNPYSCYGILDISTGKIEWAGYLPERTTLHTPLLTPCGSILVFQNSTESNSLWPDKKNDRCLQYLYQRIPPQDPSEDPEPRMWVSITEYDPITNDKVWEYTANPKKSLVATLLGSAQRLSNGNTLVCVASDNRGGQIFEVTPQKEIVWSYESSDINLDTKGPVSFYRAKRISLNIAKKIIPGFKP